MTPLLSLLAGAVFMLACAGAAAAGELKSWQGPERPSFVLSDLTGADKALAGWRGRPVLLHFFATWCEPCRPEMQSLDRLVARMPEGALTIVSVSVAEPDLRVRRFFATLPVRFPVLLDRDRAVSKAWGVNVLPTTFLLDAGLKPRFVVERDLEWDAIDLAALLGRLPGGPDKQKSNNQHPGG